MAETKITPNEINNPYKFSAFRNGAQNSINGFSKVLLETELYDTNADFNTSTNRYVASVAGYYQFSGGVAMSSSATPVWQAFLYKNGLSVKGGTLTNSSAAYQSSQVSGQIQLAVGDYVELYIYASAAIPLAPGAVNSYLDGFLVSTT